MAHDLVSRISEYGAQQEQLPISQEGMGLLAVAYSLCALSGAVVGLGVGLILGAWLG